MAAAWEREHGANPRSEFSTFANGYYARAAEEQATTLEDLKEFAVPETHALDNIDLCKALLAVMCMRAGKPIDFSQEDFDAVFGKILLEGRTAEGHFSIHAVDELPSAH
jgi:hypothetical protein